MNGTGQHVNAGRRVTQATLWFGVLGGAIAWFVHLVLVYTLAEAACITGFPWFTVLGFHGALLLIVIVTLLTLAVTVASGVVAYWNRQLLDAGGSIPPLNRGASKQMVRSGVYLSVFFVFLILVETLPIFFMRPCP